MKKRINPDFSTADKEAGYDAACKKILSEKIILAWIMKSCVEEFRNTDVAEIAEKYIEGVPQISIMPLNPEDEIFEGHSSRITGMDTEDKSIQEGTVLYDIRFHATYPERRENLGLIMNVEAQSDFYPGYPVIMRGIYYCGRMISAQHGTEFTDSHYEKIKKVYSIWICMNPPKARRNSITRYRFFEEQLIGKVNEELNNYDLMTVIMICLGERGMEAGSEILKLLNVLFSVKLSGAEKKRILQDDFGITMSNSMEDEVNGMSNLGEGLWMRAEAEGIEKGIEEGIEKGMKKGMEKGMAEGMEKGKAESFIYSIRSLMVNMQMSAEQAMSVLNVPEEEREKYCEMLSAQK